MRQRTRSLLLAVLLVLCVLAAALYLFQKAPPKVARLLPESDAIVFFNLQPLRAATHFDRSPVPRSPSYRQFIDATGIVAERDLDRAAFALHRMPDPRGPNGPVAFSEVFEGRFDPTRLAAYLAAQATAQETYAGHTVYAIPSEARTLRVALLGSSLVAASNAPTPEQIHSILDRARSAANPFAGCSLLNARFHDVPVLSSAWAIGHLALPFAEPTSVPGPVPSPDPTRPPGQPAQIVLAGLTLPLSPDDTFIASLRYTGALRLRIDQLTLTEAQAGQSAQSLTALLNLYRSVQLLQQPDPHTPSDIAVRHLLESIQIEPHRDRATLTATLPAETLKHVSTPTP